ncbi:hypothetical protein Q8A73_017584 [Channa argus]|nr:hypothetical protein Q8A73_017584 [Channa argus]
MPLLCAGFLQGELNTHSPDPSLPPPFTPSLPPFFHSGSAGVHMIKQGTQETERRSESSGTCREATTTSAFRSWINITNGSNRAKHAQWDHELFLCNFPGYSSKHYCSSFPLHSFCGLTNCHTVTELEWGRQRVVVRGPYLSFTLQTFDH